MGGDPAVPLRGIGGAFYRAIRADRLDAVLAPPGPDSAGRYHRHGQSALYLTAQADWAIIAIGPYLREDGAPRVVVPVAVDAARVIDQRDTAACERLGIDREASNEPWRASLARGVDPPSWRAADRARAVGADGIIDRSRGIGGGWHVVLFRWNTPGAPTVSVSGPPLTIDYHAARARWPVPPGRVRPEDR